MHDCAAYTAEPLAAMLIGSGPSPPRPRENASIINGAQTQGELKRYFDREDSEGADFMVRAEIVMEPLRDQIVESNLGRAGHPLSDDVVTQRVRSPEKWSVGS
jgi:hypothetical protein